MIEKQELEKQIESVEGGINDLKKKIKETIVFWIKDCGSRMIPINSTDQRIVYNSIDEIKVVLFRGIQLDENDNLVVIADRDRRFSFDLLGLSDKIYLYFEMKKIMLR